MANDRTIEDPDDNFRFRPNLIDPLKEERVLKLVEMLLEQEKHFNSLCVEFKKLASIWLLSTFAGIGFILANDVGEDAGINDWTLIGLVGFGGSIGIFVLWVADLRVYQRLLSAVFYWRGAIEYKASWLPPIHRSMRENIFGKSVGFALALIYVCPFVATSGVGVFGIYRGWQAGLSPEGAPASDAMVYVIVAVILILAVGVFMYFSSIPKDGFNRATARSQVGDPLVSRDL